MSDIPPVHIDTSASTATARALPPQASSPLSPSEQLAEGFFGPHKAEKKKELQERGILKDDRISPVLQAQAEALKHAQLANTLEHKISARPAPEELVSHGILTKDEAPIV